MGDYLTTGLFVSGCYFSVICSNKLLNFVLFHKYSFSLIILKFSVKPYIPDSCEFASVRNHVW